MTDPESLTLGNRVETVDGLIADLTDTANYAVDGLNQYTDIPGSVTPAYDEDCNTLTTELRNGGTAYTATLTWDAENRLVKVEDGTTEIATYGYDHLGRRVFKKVGSETRWFVYDGWNMVADYTQTGTGSVSHHRRYVWGLDLAGQSGGSAQGAGGVGGLLPINDTVAGREFIPSYDGNGNVTQIFDDILGGGGGRIQRGHYEYDAFGNVIDARDLDNLGSVDDNPIRFSTKYQDDETGLYYYGYRYYNPSTGRWPSRDPIAERGGVNLYGFVGNDGVSRVDILGMEPNFADAWGSGVSAPTTFSYVPGTFVFDLSDAEEDDVEESPHFEPIDDWYNRCKAGEALRIAKQEVVKRYTRFFKFGPVVGNATTVKDARALAKARTPRAAGKAGGIGTLSTVFMSTWDLAQDSISYLPFSKDPEQDPQAGPNEYFLEKRKVWQVFSSKSDGGFLVYEIKTEFWEYSFCSLPRKMYCGSPGDDDDSDGGTQYTTD